MQLKTIHSTTTTTHTVGIYDEVRDKTWAINLKIWDGVLFHVEFDKVSDDHEALTEKERIEIFSFAESLTVAKYKQVAKHLTNAANAVLGSTTVERCLSGVPCTMLESYLEFLACVAENKGADGFSCLLKHLKNEKFSRGLH